MTAGTDCSAFISNRRRANIAESIHEVSGNPVMYSSGSLQTAESRLEIIYTDQIAHPVQSELWINSAFAVNKFALLL